MRALKNCLWIGALGCLISIAGLFMPVRMFESILVKFGAEALEITPALEYMIRLTCITYVAIGIFLAILARRPADYGVMVPFVALASVTLGVFCAITGLILQLPVTVYIANALSLTLWGIILYGLCQKHC